MPAEHKHISPTADIVAFLRADTDIPYCREIAAMLDLETSRNYFKGDLEQIDIRRALVELRFKALNVLIRRLKIGQVLELASGMSPCGLVLSTNSALSIVETDLPDSISKKQKIVESLIGSPARPNYQLCPANALHVRDLWDATGSFKKQPVTIVHEGLMQYLDASEKKQLAMNIRALLEHYGGAWVTTDVITKEYFDRFYRGKAGAAMVQTVTDASKRNIMDNAFIDRDEAVRFFQDEGFMITCSKQIQFVPEMRARAFSPELRERVEYEEIWMMRLSK